MINQFKINKIKKNIYKIEEIWFKEHANLYCFKGKKYDLLVDCGLGLFNIKKFLHKKGFKNIKVVLTHAHFDHAAGLKDFSPKDILITKEICKNLKNKKMWGLQYLNQKDFNSKIASKAYIKKISASNLFCPKGVKARKIKKIDTGYFCFKAVSLPGHTDDSVGYYDKANKILVTGDALYNGKIYFDFLNSNRDDFKKSLIKILKLDFDIILPGHNNVFSKKQAFQIVSKWNRDIKIL